MGKYTSKEISDEQYIEIIECIRNGFGIHRPNLRTSVILQVAFNTGMSILDIIDMKPCYFREESNVWLYDCDSKIYVIPKKILKLIEDYYEKTYQEKMDYLIEKKIFGRISNQAIWKTMRIVTDYLELENVSPYSFKKNSIKRVFEASEYSDEMVYEFLQSRDSATVNDILSSIDGKERKSIGNLSV